MSIYELIMHFNYTRCRKGYIWCTDGSFVSPSEFKKSNKTAYGYALNSHTVVSLKRSTLYFTWIGAKFYCTSTKHNNGGKIGYLPDKDELALLYSSVMTGKMRKDLIEAEIYEKCNYRSASKCSSSGESNWYYIWSNSENSSTGAYDVDYDGNVNFLSKSNDDYAIPFFKF